MELDYEGTKEEKEMVDLLDEMVTEIEQMHVFGKRDYEAAFAETETNEESFTEINITSLDIELVYCKAIDEEERVRIERDYEDAVMILKNWEIEQTAFGEEEETEVIETETA
ncbi:hypothetical protein CHS0354_021578, partial [Potamilus streckersoni]